VQGKLSDAPGLVNLGQIQLDVIPAKAGIHLDLDPKQKWIPAFAGMTTCEGFLGAGDYRGKSRGSSEDVMAR
jgi:hypothetical protein